MKRLLFLLIWPCLLRAQSAKDLREARKQYAARADTAFIPKPFEFVFIDTCNLSKMQIYSRCYEWVVNHFHGYQSNLGMHDSLIGKLLFPEIRSAYNDDYRYTLAIDIKEGKYRCTFKNIYDVVHKGTVYESKVSFDSIAEMKMLYIGPGTKKQHWQIEKLHLKDEIEATFASISESVRKKDDF